MPTPQDQIVMALSKASLSPVLARHALAGETTFRIGGPSRIFCLPRNAESLKKCLQVAREYALRVFILGGGSNVLFSDQGFDGLVVSTRSLNSYRVEDGGVLRVGAGLSNKDLTQITMNQSLAGFEWASGLPGTVGGGVTMNAKCYGGCFADIVAGVTALTLDGRSLELAPADCQFGYKASVFQKQELIITDVRLQLAPGNPDALNQLCEQNLADRIAKGQFLFPSAGCVFKNAYDINTPAGKLIEDCDLKGMRIGGAQVFEKHANFIVNTGEAKAQDVIDLIRLIKERVKEKFNYDLQEELRIVA